MRITIIDWQMQRVQDIVEGFEILELLDFLAEYRHFGYKWFVTPYGSHCSLVEAGMR